MKSRVCVEGCVLVSGLWADVGTGIKGALACGCDGDGNAASDTTNTHVNPLMSHLLRPAVNPPVNDQQCAGSGPKGPRLKQALQQRTVKASAAQASITIGVLHRRVSNGYHHCEPLLLHNSPSCMHAGQVHCTAQNRKPTPRR